ncbi:MAG: hypothetical protein ACFFB5_06560, partial [Promethearchaeota archaeon]
MICKFKRNYVIKELKLIILFIFIVFISTPKLAGVGLKGNDKSIAVKEAEYQAGTIFTEEYENGTQFGCGDIIQ